MIRVLVVEDVSEMRELIAQVLSELPDVQISGKAANLWQARIEVSRRRPDLVLLDEVLPGESALDWLPELNELGIPVLLITSLEDRGGPVPVGAAGRITKPGWRSMEADRVRIGGAIRQAAQRG